MDSTCLYINKSQDFKFARSTYTVYKKRPLVKPTVTCATDGYIVSIDGPFLSNQKNSDGHILNYMIDKGGGISNFLRANDVIVCDRGFQHSAAKSKKGFDLKFPVCSKNPTVSELNRTRLVTKVR
jgi:hypothetical protein